MAGKSKTRKRRNSKKARKKVKKNEDRISSLPDYILRQILSLTDVKTAVQTCLVSKRWRNLWTFLSDLVFDSEMFSCYCPIFPYEKCHHQTPRFEDFVSQVLSRRDDSTNIFKFYISVDESLDYPNLVEGWLYYAFSHKVRQLGISLGYDSTPFEFPEFFFGFEHLTLLKLKNCYQNILIPKSMSLPALEELDLEGFSFRYDDGHYSYFMGQEPFSLGFPKLEKLILRNCDLSGLMIRASKLRSLEMLFEGYHPQFSTKSKNVVVSTPSLTSFKFVGQVSLDCVMDVPCLDKVYIDQWICFEEPDTDNVEQRMPLNLVKMLVQLGNAKSVTLSLETAEVLAMDPGALETHPSPFCNMKHLKFVAQKKWKIYRTLDVAPEVISYLTEGSPDNMVLEFPALQPFMSNDGVPKD